MSAHNADIQLQPESQSLEHSLSRQGRKLSLSSSLLITTDLEPLVKGFAAEVRAVVHCEGIEFVNAERGIMVRDGEMRRHSCCYSLKIRDWAAGKMKFTRGRRFTKDELVVLESLLAELLFPLRRALMHRGAPKRRLGPDQDRATVRSDQRRQDKTTTAAPRYEHSAAAPETRRLSLVPLGMDGDYQSELTESRPHESEPTLFRPITNSLLASAQGGLAFGHDGKLDQEKRALFSESIARSGISEQELFKEAREVLGYLVYSDEALVFMSVYGDETLTLSGDRPV